ncbi:MAG: outer membrane protein assembly factor BamB family protein [Deferrisomatales bacterium]
MRRVGALAAVALLAGCAAAPQPGAPRDLVWEGEVRIEDDLVVPRGTRLVLRPGTTVRFAFADRDGDGWGDVSLRVEGDLVAQGTPAAPVVCPSAAEPAEPGAWGEVRIDFGRFELGYAVVEGSTRGLHAHFSRGRVSDSVFRRNVDGTRLGESTVEVTHCLFYGHPGKALNARRCRNRVHRNLFRHNRSAIFLFEADGGSSFEGNAFRGNDVPFRLGDFFEGRVLAPGNDWGGQPPEASQEPGAELVAGEGPAPGAGPRGWPVWHAAWEARLDGFADADPAVSDEGVYAAAWGGQVVRLGFLDGQLLASARLPDAVDAGPALGPGVAAAPAWDRGLYLLGRPDLRVLDVFREAPSAADDHRQSAPVFAGRRLYAATWAGRVRGFETASGRLEPRWEFGAGGPFRAGLVLAGGHLLAPCEDGGLYALDPATGALRWRFDAGAPLVSTPAAEDAVAYLADRGGRLHAVDLATGRPRWRAALGGPAWHAAPLLDGGVVYQGDDSGALAAFDPASGRPRWVRPRGAGVRSPPAAVAGGGLAVTTLGGRLYLLDAATGLERDAWELGEASLSGPAPAGSRVVVGARDGVVRALDIRIETFSIEKP